jgi:hypothetical protein
MVWLLAENEVKTKPHQGGSTAAHGEGGGRQSEELWKDGDRLGGVEQAQGGDAAADGEG